MCEVSLDKVPSPADLLCAVICTYEYKFAFFVSFVPMVRDSDHLHLR